MDGRTDGQNSDSQDSASIAASLGKNSIQVKWRQFVRNDEIMSTTGLSIISSIISHCRNTAILPWYQEETPSHKALRYHVDLTLGRPLSREWNWPPGWLRCRWIDQIRNQNDNAPSADHWRSAIRHGATLYGPRSLCDDDDDKHWRKSSHVACSRIDCRLTPRSCQTCDSSVTLTVTFTAGQLRRWLLMWYVAAATRHALVDVLKNVGQVGGLTPWPPAVR